MNPQQTIRGAIDLSGDLSSLGATLRGDASSMASDRTIRPNQPSQATVARADEDFHIKGETYHRLKCLSDNSGEAQVFLVEHNGEESVLKVYYPNFDINKKLFQVIHSFQFEMIVRLFDYGKVYVDGKNRYYERMEYLCGGTLQDVHLDGDHNQFRRIALQAAAALAYCHNNNILHKDIKPTNFFFRDEARQELVLGDFGISSILENDGKSFRTTQARTPIYAAPEMYSDVIDGEVEVTPAADFYSLGMTLFALWLGENPMSANERVMMRQKNEGRLPRLGELPDSVRRIVQGLTAVNPQSRWGYEQVERWFLGEDVPVDISSPFLRYKTFVVDPDRNLVAENVHELIPLLVENERLAINYLYNGRIASWLESCGNSKLSAIVKDIVQNRYPVDQSAGLMAAVYAMEPTYPYADVKGNQCDDIHAIALSLLSYQEEYALLLQNPNDRLFLWLEQHTQGDIARLRSYFATPEGGTRPDGRVSILRLVYEIDPDIPFLSRRPSSTISEIVHSFGYTNPSEDDWHSLTDGRLLSWMYSHEDIMASESLRIMTQDQEYSQALAYKVLYDIDRHAAYDLREADTPEAVGELLADRLMQAEHLSNEDLEREMQDFTDPNGRFTYFAQLHGWYDKINEAKSCFDLRSEENRERLSAYDLRTALYRYVRILGATPRYLLPSGVEISDGRNIEPAYYTQVRSEIRSGAFLQWSSVFFHEDPQADFTETYSYEHALEDWVMSIGQYDPAQPYYKRFVTAREETTQRINAVRQLWKSTMARQNFWRITCYALFAVWLLLVLIVGVTETGMDWLRWHWMLGICLPLGTMTGIIASTRAYFSGFGPTTSFLLGVLGAATSIVPVLLLRYMAAEMPSLYNVALLAISAVYILICRFTDFSRDTKTDNSLIQEVLATDDIKTSLLEPLYYTFKTKSFRYKSSKFGMIDQVADQVRSVGGETVLHYILWAILAIVLVGQFVIFSPKLMNSDNPVLDNTTVEQVYEQTPDVQK